MEFNVFNAQWEHILHRDVQGVHLAKLDTSLTPHNQDAVPAYRAAGLAAETMSVNHVKTARFPLEVCLPALNVTLERHRIKNIHCVKIALRDSSPQLVMLHAVPALAIGGRHQDPRSVANVNWAR